MNSWLVNHTLLIILFVVGSAVSQSNRTCMGPFHNSLGYTTPAGNILLPLGSPLEIYCTLHTNHNDTKNHTADDLIFKKGDETIDKKYVTVVNETTARLYMENVPLTEDIKYYYCYLVLHDYTAVASRVHATDHIKKHPLMVCVNYVEIGVSPRSVDNFTCVSRHLEILNCTWDEPNNGIYTKYQAYYSSNGGRDDDEASKTWYRCPKSKKGICTWTKKTDPPYLSDAKYINVRIDGSNKFGNSTQTMEFDSYLNMIPNRPSKPVAMSSTSRSVHLQWNIGSLKNFDKCLIYKVNYTWYLPKYWRDEVDFESFENPHIRDFTLGWDVRLYNSTEVERDDDEIQVNVTNLPYPNLGYQFKIEMKSALAGHESWSKPAFVNVKTDPCPPYRSPETDVGSFSVFNQFEDRRDVFVYWKSIPEEEYNGNEFRYEIVAFENNVKSNILPDSVSPSYAKYTNLTLNSYKFVITSVNSIGSAAYSTSVRLPKQKYILPELSSFSKMENDDGTYQLSWKPPKFQVNVKITNITIYWCENNQLYPAFCRNFLQWTHLPADAVDHSVKLKPNTQYQFALSVNSVYSTSGMSWAQCTIYRNESTSMSNVWIDELGSNFIDIRWALECSERNPDIKSYHITYCPVNQTDLKTCTEAYKTFKIYGDVNTQHAKVTGLQPLTGYKFTVASYTKQIGRSSKEMYSRTLQAAPDMSDVVVKIFNITNTSAIAEWNQPAKLNGILDHYEFSYDNNIVIVNDTKAILTGLSSFQQYGATVTACTSRTLCSRSNPVNFQTSVGNPGEVTKFHHEKDVNGRKKLIWEPPEDCGGPNPTYEVRIALETNNTRSTFGEFETKGTETFAEAPCEQDYYSHATFVFYVRAKNIVDINPNNIKYFFGPWTEAYTINCTTQITPKIIIASLGLLLILSLGVILGRKAVRKYRKMKNVQVTLPPSFLSLIQNETKNSSESQRSAMDDDRISLYNVYLNPCYGKDAKIIDTTCNMS
ncbi:cytokine receptor-like [Planococcus citri]|uniref:cytokine receptor-like n=1 Tax=Planococcus citri TaxID=170843 RepID=UPI0031F7EACB